MLYKAGPGASQMSNTTVKALQKFTPESLERCKNMTPLQIVEFLEAFAANKPLPEPNSSPDTSVKQ